MKTLRFLLVMVMFAICSTASAQFTNARSSSAGSFSSGDGPQVGYKGFVDAGFAFGTGDNGLDRLMVTTTHGYQVLPYFYAGAGLGINYYTEEGFDDISRFTVPIFADFRATLDSKITPFFDLKIGYSIGDLGGCYIAPSVGCRIGMGEKSALNIGVGYESQTVKDAYKVSSGAIALKIGFDF